MRFWRFGSPLHPRKCITTPSQPRAFAAGLTHGHTGYAGCLPDHETPPAGFMARLFGIFAPARSRKSPSGKSSRCQCGVNCTLRRIRRGSMVCRWQLATPRMGTKSVLSSAVRSKSEGMIWVIRAMLILVRNLLYLPNCTPFSWFSEA